MLTVLSCHSLAIIADIGVSYQTHLVHPRGLINRGNLCFINAILQPLLHTAPFYNAFRKLLLETTPKMITSAPLLDAMLRFWAEFHEDTPGSKLQLTEGDDPTAFAPEYVYTAVRKLRKIDAQQKGRQEDAEEFLGFIIDGLHEELVSLQKEEGSAEAKSPDSDGSWVEVGKTGKNLVTRNVRVETSPVNAIFGGRLRSVVKCPGRKDSVTTEPFQALQLDIAPNHVHTISDALQHLHALETLEGFTSPTKSNRLGTATKQNFLEVLPPVLILHLKRFVYDADKGVGKLGKFVGYDSVLRIPTELMPAPLRPTAKHIEYRLTAVVYHHGAHAAGGHYTCDVSRQAGGEWLRVDDAAVGSVPEREVVGRKEGRDAYLLFYTRT
ncbi:cysteine proteinase [Fimicolochytrium jonesii]|uniref:cysteine proteinase n=1 Tax=Fimicolochytrium jonesii TaxID=1396493 RepID=UPI0022FF2911|nr:cysteine proteinase [Fimicolochytrium jonesii]KAI8822691.1 cysteine proteinase [Fimicolochytrium jonesii]